ncbi:ABC transporter permease [uncultured Eubacterium sp.]|uniref:ABC transporter permease n=1 Tax=uncultured Eubacterium sp. TaxID=165185 RepID=UPI002594CDDC|nr:ABC transporter permease [uncultured Eubacterium sp.]
MLENIRLSFQGIWSHKMRSFLTMLGIIIGIGAIIAIVSTIQGTNEQIKQNLVGAGNNAVTVQLYQDEWTYEMDYNGIPDGVPVISDDTMQQILAVDGVEEASRYTSRQGYDAVCYGNTSLSGGYVMGVDANYLDTCSYTIKEGRGFDSNDYAKYRKVAILDRDSASSLFQGADAIGKTIEIQGEPYIVVGIADKKDGFEPVINSMDDYYTYMQDSSGRVFIPSATWPIVFQYDEPQSVVLKATDTDSMASAGQAVADILNANLNVSDSTIQYKGQDLLKQAQDIQELSQSTNRMLIWIAGISLLVGGIGVMNIMLVSVTERTQEIGLKKAIGAKKSHILGQFLTEAAVLTSLGGIIGVIAGIVLAEVISKVSEMPVVISIPAAIIAVGFSMGIGIIFGLLPSYKAANLKPIDALRRE